MIWTIEKIKELYAQIYSIFNENKELVFDFEIRICNGNFTCLYFNNILYVNELCDTEIFPEDFLASELIRQYFFTPLDNTLEELFKAGKLPHLIMQIWNQCTEEVCRKCGYRFYNSDEVKELKERYQTDSMVTLKEGILLLCKDDAKEYVLREIVKCQDGKNMYNIFNNEGVKQIPENKIRSRFFRVICNA